MRTEAGKAFLYPVYLAFIIDSSCLFHYDPRKSLDRQPDISTNVVMNACRLTFGVRIYEFPGPSFQNGDRQNWKSCQTATISDNYNNKTSHLTESTDHT